MSLYKKSHQRTDAQLPMQLGLAMVGLLLLASVASALERHGAQKR